MNEHLLLVLWFGLGVGLQVLLLIRGDWNWGKLAVCIIVGAAGMLPGKHEHQYQPYIHILIALGLFAFIFAIWFKDDLLPVISEKVLLSYSLIFWFAFFSFYYQGTERDNIFLGFLSLPSAATIFIALQRPKLNFVWKLCLYTWFLAIVVSLGLLQFPFQHLSIFLSPQANPWLTPLDCIVAGMAFLYLAVNIAYLYELIPIPGKNQSWKDRMKEWHELTDLMTQRFEDEPMHRVGLSLLVGQGVALLLIYWFHWVSAGLAINFFVVLPSILAFGKNSTSLALQQQRSAWDAVAAAHAGGVKIDGNDPCPCGSAMKFKFCHGAAGSVADQT